MIFTLKRDREITKKAEEIGYYYTAEFAVGYMMTHHPIEFILDIFIPIIPIGLFLWILCR